MADELTITLSGPGGFRSQALTALKAEGFAEAPVMDSTRHDPSHGLPDTVSGDHDPTVGWITVTGHDIDTAQDAVAALGWQLRAHHTQPFQTHPLLEEIPDVREMVRDEMARIMAEAKS